MERLSFGVWGDDVSEGSEKAVREALAETMGETAWPMLEAHAKRGGLIFVAPSLVLLDVAVAVALDQSAEVAAWMEQGLVTRPEPDALCRYGDDADKEWSFVIVQPFVLVTGAE